MNTMFSYSTTGTTSTISVAPTLIAQIGSYTITTTACLTGTSQPCVASLPFQVIVNACSLVSIQIVQQSGLSALIA